MFTRRSLLIWVNAMCGLFSPDAWSPLQAQLAITEVMSSASTNLGPTRVDQHADYWELTNFGNETVGLGTCLFNDSGGLAGAESEMFSEKSIRAGESIICAQWTENVCTNREQFLAWWGATNVPGDLQVLFYHNRGFSSKSDAVQLWRAEDGVTSLVQRVELHQARMGYSFTYDPATGEVDRNSELGQGRAFKAVEADDVGSPGWAVGPVPLVIVQPPRSLDVDAGTPAQFSVRATGLPTPRFQWRFNGTNLLGATSDTFTIPNAVTNDAGIYTVELSNGIEARLSRAAVLTVNAKPSAARITVPPASLAPTPGQTVTFAVVARGFPLPSYQWQHDGLDLEDATNATLTIPNVAATSAGTYCVRVWNQLGSTNACAILTVLSKPQLVITEMMGASSTNTTVAGHGDWWELTSFDAHDFDLTGCRFDDFPGVPDGAMAITNAVVIQPDVLYVTNRVVIQPGESLLFVSDMTAEAFACWWGEASLPERTQFVCYVGNGFQATGDSVTLWNATATDPNDFLARAEYVNLNPDFTPVVGKSLAFWCDGWIEFGLTSKEGVCGAIRAVEADDIGSPGFIVNHPPRIVAARPPWCVGIARDREGSHLTWGTQAGRRYELQCKRDLAERAWTPLSQHAATSPRTLTTDPAASGQPQRFYRLIALP